MIYKISESHSRCCGSVAYDNQTEVCKNNEVRDRHEWEMKPNKCGPLYYNPTNQSCCLNELIGPGQTCCENGVYATPGTPLNEGGCCNSEGFNQDTHICCSAKLYLKTST
ncbi:galaxin-like, partial [Anneissia japonica]|uniref:galaxin-like n=1 Tax=Anneissia japonica TaxID=1529436 RepID=UPI001425933C